MRSALLGDDVEPVVPQVAPPDVPAVGAEDDGLEDGCGVVLANSAPRTERPVQEPVDGKC